MGWRLSVGLAIAAVMLLQPQQAEQGELGQVRSLRVLAWPRITSDQSSGIAADPDTREQVRAWEQADDD